MTPNTFPYLFAACLGVEVGKRAFWCLFAQGSVVRSLGDGRGWKALVARRCRAQKRVLPGDLPSLASSCRLDPGCAHCPISASPANLISARNLEAAADRSGLLGGLRPEEEVK